MSVGVAARVLATPSKLGVRRCLFGPVNKEDTRVYLKELNDMLDARLDCKNKWNFNFSTDTPMQGRFQWEKVNTPVKSRDGPPPVRPKSMHRRPKLFSRKTDNAQQLPQQKPLASLVPSAAVNRLMPTAPTNMNSQFTCSCRLAVDKPAVDFSLSSRSSSHPKSCSVEHWVAPASAVMSVAPSPGHSLTVTTKSAFTAMSAAISTSSVFNFSGKSAPTTENKSPVRIQTRSISRKRKQTRISEFFPQKKSKVDLTNVKRRLDL